MSSKKKKTPTQVNSEEKSTTSKLDGQIVNDTYRVGKKIGSGSYGQIRVGIHLRTGKRYAIKFEPVASDSQLASEYGFYQVLVGKKGFPSVSYFGRHLEYQVLVMEMLGKNLESVFDLCGRRFSLKAIIFVVLQLLKRFETIHKARIVYRDVKPENFVLGARTNTVHVIDFGLSKYYADPTTGKHVAPAQTHELIGTSRYMSINAHLLREQSRRDDLEAVGYVLVYFLRLGKLPWSGLKVPNFNEHNRQICELKRTIPDEELVAGAPEEFLYYLKYVRSLDFEAEPNYEKLRNMFKRLFHLQQFKDDGIYDWNT